VPYLLFVRIATNGIDGRVMNAYGRLMNAFLKANDPPVEITNQASESSDDTEARPCYISSILILFRLAVRLLAQFRYDLAAINLIKGG
jgi:hypothetical protein